MASVKRCVGLHFNILGLAPADKPHRRLLGSDNVRVDAERSF